MLQRWRFAWAWFVGATLIAGCGLLPDPKPPEPPTPWECPLPYPSCDQREPPQHCSSDESPCWHNPTQDPEHCEEAVKCEEPPPPELPQPQCPSFTDRGGTLRLMSFLNSDRTACDCWFGETWHPCPVEPPGECCIPHADDPEWGVAYPPEQKPTHYLAEYRRAIAAVGDRCGQPEMESLRLVGEALVAQGLCARGPEADSVSILRNGAGEWYAEHPNVQPDFLYEEWHAVFFGNGCLIDGANAHKGTWKFNGDECNNPVPPPGGACVDPDPTGYGAEFGLKKHGQLWDSTYRVRSREYCDQVCSPIEPDVCFTGRNACPLRMEGDPEREVCERQEIGDQKWWCDGQPIESNENPAQARCHGHVKTCTEDGRTCAEADW